jgi:hypothetical protein
MLRWISTWVLALFELSAILVSTEKLSFREFRPRNPVMTAIRLFTVTNGQHHGTFLQQAHHCRFLAIAFAEIKLG